MRILVITKNAWDDRIASGNTLSNLFGSWKDAEIFTIYCRETLPNNSCCNNYFTSPPINLIKNFFIPWRIGIKYTSMEFGKKSNNTENTLAAVSKKSVLFALLYDLLYSTRFWLNKKMKNYIREANPDIVFCFGVPDAFNYYLVKYIKRTKVVPLVSFFVDNLYKKEPFCLNLLGKVNNKRLLKLASLSDKRYAISQQMCDEYNTLMDVDFELLTKGCIIKGTKQHLNNPIRLTYAGNLYYGRDNTLSRLAMAINKINTNTSHVKYHLDIYTASHISAGKGACLNLEGASSVHPPKQYAEIESILHESDIVLHVESFDESQINSVRLSFSTKITDCLQSGSMVLAIGPKELATINYLQQVPGAVVITDLDKIESVLIEHCFNISNIIRNAKATNAYTKKTMTIDIVRGRLQRDFINIIHKNRKNNDRT